MATLLLLVIQLGLLLLCGWALFDAVRRPAGAFPAHGKLTKNVWLVILGVSALVIWAFGFRSLLGLPAVVATIVYLVDVRPAVSGTSNPW